MIIKRLIYTIYVVLYTILCTKAMNFPLIKDKHSLFFNEFINILPIVYKNIFNSNIFQSGNLITTNKIDIVVANHINRFDFLILFSIIRNNTDSNIYPILHKGLTKIPFVNSIAPTSIIITRNIVTDTEIIKNFIKKIDNCILVIYPEGTRINENNFEESHIYCDKNNLKKYNHLLYPKMKGLDLIINELNNNNKLGNLIDISIKVKNNLKFKTGYFDFIKYNIGDVYCNVNTFKINKNVFNNYDLFKKWFLMIWDKKEDYFDNYYNYNYTKLNYIMKTSTFVLHICFANFLIFYMKTFTNFNFSNKKKIIIK